MPDEGEHAYHAAVRAWQEELMGIADRMESGASRFMLARDARQEIHDMSDRAGLLRSDGPWASIPHAEVVMDISKQVRRVARMLDEVLASDPPEEDSDGE